MFIESLIRPSAKPSRIVTINGVAIEFSPVVKGRYVAEVIDPEAQRILLSHPKVYREFTDQVGIAAAPGPSLSKAPAPPAPAPAPPPPPAPPATPPAPTGSEGQGASTDTGNTGGNDGSSTADEVTAAAQALLQSTPTAIKKQVEKHQPPKAVLERAVAIESAEKRPRQQILALLKATLSAIDA